MSRSGSNTVATKGIRVIAVVVAGVLATMLGACSSDKPKAVPITTTDTTQAVVPNPLTGIVPSPNGPVIAVKVDDTAPGRPSLGVDRADVIYIEEVEGGLTRMLAVFASAKPDVRAVRSIRPSDPELLGQYGKIIVVASGGGGPALRILDKSTLNAVINDRGQVGFRRDPSRPAPYNLVSNLTKVSAAVKGDGVRDVGFTWAASDPQLAAAKAATKVSTRVGSTPVTFVWDPDKARYARTVNGRPIVTASGARVAKPNVLVQFCKIVPDPNDRDVNRNPTMFTKTIGSGPVVLFRSGKRIAGTWSRPALDAPTTFRDAAGKPLRFAPGGTFVALVRRGAPA
jgi:Protein of unknown function (DUF3048) N-terminal domain/Protein of unknown function (DUF3048) C-terminal domain